MWSDTSTRALLTPATPAQGKTPNVNALLQIEGLSKAFVPAKPVFADVSFSLTRGEFVCIIGHSGCGKTTILNVLPVLAVKSPAPAWSAAWCSKATR